MIVNNEAIGGNQAAIDSLNLVGADTTNRDVISSLNAIRTLQPDFGLVDNPFENTASQRDKPSCVSLLLPFKILPVTCTVPA